MNALRPTIALVGGDGTLQYQSNGPSLTQAVGPRTCKTVEFAVSQTGGQTKNVWKRYVVSSLAEHICNMIDSRITGVPADVMPMWTEYPFGTNGVRNSQCWLTGIDLTCLSAFNSYGGNKKGGCLISQRHFAFATHYSLLVGNTVYFNDMNGVHYEAVIDQIYVVNEVYDSDLSIARFSAPVPVIIKPAYVLPKNFQTYLPHIPTSQTPSNYYPVAAFCTNQYEEAIVQEYIYNILMAKVEWPSNPHRCYKTLEPTVTSRQPYSKDFITGDSGSPSCLIINNQLVFLGGLLGITGGASITEYYDLVNAYLGQTGYALSDVNLTGFPTY